MLKVQSAQDDGKGRHQKPSGEWCSSCFTVGSAYLKGWMGKPITTKSGYCQTAAVAAKTVEDDRDRMKVRQSHASDSGDAAQP